MQPTNYPGFLSSFYRCPIVARLAVYILLLGLYAVGVVLVDQWYLHNLLIIRSTIHTLLGIVLGALLVFRTNTAYDRWWEGRKLWGQLVNDTRNLAIKVETCVQAPSGEKQRFAQHLIAFAMALRDHLRGPIRLQDYPGFQNATENPPHVPAAISQSLYGELESWRTRPRARRDRVVVSRSACRGADEYLRRLRTDSQDRRSRHRGEVLSARASRST